MQNSSHPFRLLATALAVATAVLAMVLLTLSAKAADAPCPLSVDQVAATMDLNYRDLMLRRGLPQPGYYFDDIEAQVAGFLEGDQAPGDGRPRGLLIYVASGDTVCVALWRSDGEAPAAFLVSPGKARMLSLIDQLVSAVRRGGQARSAVVPRLRSGTTRGPDPVTPAIPVDNVVRDLTAALFPPPVASELTGLAALYVVPAVNIGIVPFSMLDPQDDGHPLAETTSVTIAASLRDLLGQPKLVMSPISGQVVVIGDPDASQDPDWVFPPLPAARREATEIASLFETSPVLGSDATVAEALNRLQGADYIHIAAHGLSDPNDPLDGSFLAFAGGRLTARQIQALSVGRYSIAVMSACQTGLGGVHEGGIIGLARAFLIAGSGIVVASLWNVDDDATEFMMVRFARLLGTNDPASALRLAQLDTRARWPDPAQWASFQVFGLRVLSGGN